MKKKLILKRDPINDFNNLLIGYGLLKDFCIKKTIEELTKAEININKFNASLSNNNKTDLSNTINYIKNVTDKYLNNTMFLMTFSFLEEFMFILAQGLNVEIISKKGFQRFKPVIKKLYGEDISKITEYALFTEFQYIRNAMLHSGGNINFIKDSSKQNTNKILMKHSKYFSVNKNKIEVNDDCIEFFKDRITSFLKRILPKVNSEASTPQKGNS